jgi:hypothetical protein
MTPILVLESNKKNKKIGCSRSIGTSYPKFEMKDGARLSTPFILFN